VKSSQIERLATSPSEEPPITPEEMLRVLARIARMGRPGDRLRAIELLGSRMGMLQVPEVALASSALTDDQRAERIEAILERARARRAVALAKAAS
jgi:hypothetical protein